MSQQTENNLTRKQRWVIAYDISDHRQRRMIHKLLKDHGQRVQFSVFECELSKQQRLALRAQLCEHMEETDSIRWYPLCRWCQTHLHWTGQGQPLDTNNFYIL